MDLNKVFISLGGNLGNPLQTLSLALEKIKRISGIHSLESSPFYWTSPVSPIPQKKFLNGVCSFMTSLSPQALLLHLQQIEKELGKVEKPKEAPRLLDLDILFFGSLVCNEPHLQIPHPRWKERLFVLFPLADLTSKILICESVSPPSYQEVDVFKLLKNFSDSTQTLSLAYPEVV